MNLLRKEEKNKIIDKVHALRESGKTYREIGKEFGFTANNARTIYLQWHRRLRIEKEWWSGLSVRAANCLSRIKLESREEVVKHIKSGHLKISSAPNMGEKTLVEIAHWAGLPNLIKVKPQKICPHCGKNIK